MKLWGKVVSGSLLLFAAAPLVAADVLIGRDGTRTTGVLQSCTDERCQWAGQAVPRAEIGWIGFGEGGAPPTPQDPLRDQVWLRDGRTAVGEILGLSLGSVATENDSFDRPDVTWIYFGSVTGLPRQQLATPAIVPPAPPSRTELTSAPATNSNPEEAPAVLESPAPEAPAAPALRLNEVLFLPQEKQAPFVEIVNAGTASASLDGVALRNDKGKSFAVPKGRELAAGAFLVVRFDGAKSADKEVVHAPAGDFLGRAVGALWLSTRDGTVDGVAWGVNQPRAVELCRGGRCSEPAPGSVIARLPDVATALTAAAWAPLDPDLATPGSANPRPPVSAIAGLPGMLFFGKPRFSWYSVPGAARYRLEVSRDEQFAEIVHRATVTGEGERLQQVAVDGPELPAGDYFWRVVATSASGAEAEPCSSISFFVRPLARRTVSSLGATTGPGGARTAGGGAEGPPAASPPEASVCAHIAEVASPTVCKELDVPVLDHVKDTRMLTLEAWREKPIGSWDTPDYGPYPYCARVGVQMVHEYYRRISGSPRKLSQDRIGFEVYKGLRTGPEYDLPVVGINDSDTSRFSLPLALGTDGDYQVRPYHSLPGRSSYSNSRGCMDYATEQVLAECARQGWEPRSEKCLQYMIAHETEIDCPPEIAYAWGYASLAAIRAEIDAGRPVISTNPSHLFLWIGYAEVGDDEYLIYQDAGGRQPVHMGEGGPDRAANAFVQHVESFWTGLAAVALGSDEEGVANDSDGDGLLDFDEMRRFGTKASDRDSDGDGIEDKDEIRYSVWDPEHGYHRAVQPLPSTASSFQVELAATAADLSGRDPDGDGKAMELDPDSDNGGCEDGEENLNGDGKTDPGETSNFDKSDDPTADDGSCGALWTGTMHSIFQVREEVETTEVSVRLRERRIFKLLHPGAKGMIDAFSLLDAGSLITRTHWTDMSFSPWRVQAGHGTSPAMSPAGEILRVVEEVGPAGELYWSERYYVLGLAPAGSLPFTVTTHSGYGTRTETWEGGKGSRSVNTLPSGDQPRSDVFKERHAPLVDGQMIGSYDDGNNRVSWSICRAGVQCPPLPEHQAPPPPPPAGDGEEEPPSDCDETRGDRAQLDLKMDHLKALLQSLKGAREEHLRIAEQAAQWEGDYEFAMRQCNLWGAARFLVGMLATGGGSAANSVLGRGTGLTGPVTEIEATKQFWNFLSMIEKVNNGDPSWLLPNHEFRQVFGLSVEDAWDGFTIGYGQLGQSSPEALRQGLEDCAAANIDAVMDGASQYLRLFEQVKPLADRMNRIVNDVVDKDEQIFDFCLSHSKACEDYERCR